jgi:hypothetical protein
MGIRLYKKVSKSYKKTNKLIYFKTRLKSFLLHHAFYSVHEFVTLIACVLYKCGKFDTLSHLSVLISFI